MKLNFSVLPRNLKHNIDSYRAKQASLPMEFIQCPAQISSKLETKIKRVALKTFCALNCYDLARIDIRCDKKGNPHVLEVNALPAIDPDLRVLSGYPIAIKAAGLSYEQMIEKIIQGALERYKKQKQR